jgi:hypothetical protein
MGDHSFEIEAHTKYSGGVKHVWQKTNANKKMI